MRSLGAVAVAGTVLAFASAGMASSGDHAQPRGGVEVDSGEPFHLARNCPIQRGCAAAIRNVDCGNARQLLQQFSAEMSRRAVARG